MASILANAYISLGYGALPALVVSEVDADETGVATSMNAIARTIGSSTAAALVAVLLSRTLAGTGVPMESSFVAIFIGGAATAALGDGSDRVLTAAARDVPNPRGALRIPCHEPRMGLGRLAISEGREVGDRLADVGLEHLGDQVSDPGVQQPTGELGDDLKRRPRLVVLHAQSKRDADSRPAPADQLDLLGLVVAGHHASG